MVISVIIHLVSPGKGVRPLGVVVTLGVNVDAALIWEEKC